MLERRESRQFRTELLEVLRVPPTLGDFDARRTVVIDLARRYGGLGHLHTGGLPGTERDVDITGLHGGVLGRGVHGHILNLVSRLLQCLAINGCNEIGV
ncbi:hypothetical protein D3C78_1157860 [compost metagenome]